MKELQIRNNLMKKNAKDFAYEVIKENILNLNLKPGVKIDKNELAYRLKVSNTPIRNAIYKLNGESLINVYPQSGTYVSKISVQRVKEAVFIRATIETEIVKLACQNFNLNDFFELESNLRQQRFAIDNDNLDSFNFYDNNMHEYLFKGNEFKHAWDLINNFSADYYRLRYIKLKIKLRLEETYKEHKKLIKFLKNKDCKKAKDHIKNHIEYAFKDLKTIKEKFPKYFI